MFSDSTYVARQAWILIVISLTFNPGCSCIESIEERMESKRQKMPEKQPPREAPATTVPLTPAAPPRPTPSSTTVEPTPTEGTSTAAAEGSTSGETPGGDGANNGSGSTGGSAVSGVSTSRGSTASKSSRPQFTAQQARDTGSDLIAAAAAAFAAGRPGDAFRQGLHAHEILAAHSADPACGAMLERLDGDLRRYAAAANAAFTVPPTRSKIK